jgi:diaminopimelate decarboxylase
MANAVSRLIAKRFPDSCSELIVGCVPVSALASKYGTPLFVYDRAVIDAQIDALRAALPSRFTVYFSIKANPNCTVVKHFLSRGCGLEIASAGEFQAALDAGCDPKSILFAGPGKTAAELEFVLSCGIGEIHIESLLEIERVGSIARRLGIRAQVAIRVNPGGEAEGGAMRMGGRPAPFGVDEEILDEAVSTVCADAALEFRGIHLCAGTQILNAEVLVSQYRHGLGIARRAALRARCPLATVDFGGGLGVPYFAHEEELDLERVREGLATLFSEIESDSLFSGTHFLVEPGRFLTAEAGVYIARVNDVKVSRGKKFVIVDGGMNHHLAASGNLGQTIKRNYPVALVNRLNAPNAEVVDVVGPLCTPLDTLARNVELPAAEVGDLFGIFQSGAYGRSASPLGFLSHPAPPEVWIDAGQHRLVMERGGAAALAVTEQRKRVKRPGALRSVSP